MSDLHWREAVRVELHSELVWHPADRARARDSLSDCRVAVEGAFLHIDPRNPAERRELEGRITLVPASSLKFLVWRTESRSP